MLKKKGKYNRIISLNGIENLLYDQLSSDKWVPVVQTCPFSLSFGPAMQ